jgi:CheY-like chemotaxis protein
MSLNAQVRLDYADSGVVWKFSCPSDRVIGSSDPTSDRVVSHIDSEPTTKGRRTVLLVEDDALCALDLSEHLEAAGWSVVGPAASVDQAMAAFRSTRCDIAVLDINLGRDTSEPVARALSECSTPFVVVSGYSTEQLPCAYRDAPLLTKPVNPNALVAALTKMCTHLR